MFKPHWLLGSPQGHSCLSPRWSNCVFIDLPPPLPGLDREPQGSGSSFLCLLNLFIQHRYWGDIPGASVRGSLRLSPPHLDDAVPTAWEDGSAVSSLHLLISSCQMQSILQGPGLSSVPPRTPGWHPTVMLYPPENSCPSSSPAHLIVWPPHKLWASWERFPLLESRLKHVQKPQTDLVLQTKALFLSPSPGSLWPFVSQQHPAKPRAAFPRPNPLWLSFSRTNLPLLGYLWEELSILFFFWWENSNSARNSTRPQGRS